MKRNNKTAYLMLLPIMIFAAVFVYYPFARMIVNCFSHVTPNGTITGFAGLENFRYVFARKDFQQAFAHTLILSAINVPCTLLITLTLAFIANKPRRLGVIYETLFTLPMSVSMASACMIFKAMLSPTVGVINSIFGIKYGWFDSKETALSACLTLTIWMGIGFDFLLLLSALRAIPKQIIEVTQVDGIHPLRRIFCIQLPLIAPTIFYVLCSNLILALMTSGPMIIIMGSTAQASATTTLMSLMYQTGFGNSDYSQAGVLSLVVFLLTFGLTILSFRLSRQKIHYQ